MSYFLIKIFNKIFWFYVLFFYWYPEPHFVQKNKGLRSNSDRNPLLPSSVTFP